MKIHSCKPHVFLALVIALALALFNGVARPDRPVSVSAEKVAQLAGIPDPGVECGCKKTGEFVKPARGALPEVVYTDLDSGTSPGGIYALNASGTAASTTITIRHIADNVQILSISGPGGQWGFSPDDHRFVHWYTSGANIVVKLYNLQAPDGQELVLLINLPVSDVQIRFSPNGYYLFLSRLIDADTTQLFLYHARDGEQRYTQVINFTVIPGGDGDQFGMASYGFSPDVMDRRFVYAYASGQSSVPWKMIDLKTGEVLLQRTFTGSSAFWNFSRCGDRLGIIDETTTNQYRIQLYDTLDAALIFDQVVSAALTLTLTTTENEHLAYTGSSPYSLGDNTAYANCAVIGVNALVLEKEAAVGGATVNGEIVLSGPAPAGGARVTLSSSHPSIASLPSTVTIPAGAESAGITVTTYEVTGPRDVTLTASLGSTSAAASLRVLVIPPDITGLTLSPELLPCDEKLLLTVTLEAAAPEGGAQVMLSSSGSPSLLPLPPHVNVPQGETTASIEVTPHCPDERQEIDVTASTPGNTLSVQLTLTPPIPELNTLTLRKAQVIAGNSVLGDIGLTGIVPIERLEVNLETNHPEVIDVNDQHYFYEGEQNSDFPVHTHGVAAVVETTITAELNGITRTANLVVQPANFAGMQLNSRCDVTPSGASSGKIFIGGHPISGMVYLDGAAPPNGAVIRLTSSNPRLLQAPATITIPYDQSETELTLTTSAVEETTVVELTASYRDRTSTMPITLTKLPDYTFTRLPFTPWGLNDKGQVAGLEYIYDANGLTDLGKQVGIDNLFIVDMNEHGDVIASGTVGSEHTYIYISGGQIHTIQPIEGYPEVYLEGLNDEGEVVGRSCNWDYINWGITACHAIRWKNGTTYLLEDRENGHLQNYALAINNSGKVVGYSEYKPYKYGSWYSKVEVWAGDLLQPFNFLFDHSEAMDINENGTVLFHAGDVYLMDGETLTKVPAPGRMDWGNAIALNDHNDVLYSSREHIGESSYTVPMLYDHDYGSFPLSCLTGLGEGESITSAFDINNLGQIIAVGEDRDENNFGLLLSPADVVPPDPPEEEHQVYLPLIMR